MDCNCKGVLNLLKSYYGEEWLKMVIQEALEYKHEGVLKQDDNTNRND